MYEILVPFFIGCLIVVVGLKYYIENNPPMIALFSLLAGTQVGIIAERLVNG